MANLRKYPKGCSLAVAVDWTSPGFVDSRQVGVSAARSKSIGLI